MSGFSDGILIFYGTCGHSLKNLKNEFKDSKWTFYFLKDNMGENVEDCISIVLGGNDAYATTLMNCKGVGTIFLTPMWASGWKEIFYENCFSSPAFVKNDLKRYGRVATYSTSYSRTLSTTSTTVTSTCSPVFISLSATLPASSSFFPTITTWLAPIVLA